MKTRFVIPLMLAIMSATVVQATGYFAIRPAVGVNWYVNAPATATTSVGLDDKSIHAKQLYPVLGENNWSGPADLSAIICVGFDASRMYWHINMIDDVVTNIAASSAKHMGDAFEIGFAQSNIDAKRAGILIRPTTTDMTYVYRPDDGMEVTLPSLTISTTRTATGWIVDGSCLLTDLELTVGTPFRLNILLYDRDDESSIGQDTILGMRPCADTGYSDMSVWSDADWITAPELPEAQLLDTEVKKLTDNTPVQIVGVFVTLVSNEDQCFFVEDQKRVVGFRVNFPSSWERVSQVVAGQIVNSVAGKMRIRHNQRELDAETIVTGCAGQFIGPGPLLMTGKNLGGSDPYGLIPRVGGFGPSNVGLLVKVVGTVKSVLPEVGFVLSSGDDILVYYSGSFSPTVGMTVSVVGVVTTNAGDTSKAAIQAGSNSLVAY